MGLGTVITAAVAPWARSTLKGKASEPSTSSVSVDEEMARTPLLSASLPPRQSFGSGAPAPTYSYGATSNQSTSSLHSSPERYRRDSLLGRVPEEGSEEDTEQEWDLEERGFYIGSYRRKVALYTLVPLSSLLVFVLLALLPLFIWHHEQRGPPTHTRYFPSPLPELLVSTALWSLTYLLRLPVYTLTSALLPSPLLHTLLFNIIYVLLSQLLRLSALPILRIRHEMQYPLPTWQDAAFARVWWIALGWALADVAVGTAQGYEQLALYRDVMVPEDKVRDVLLARSGSSKSHASPDEAAILSPRPDGGSPARAIKLAVDKDLEQLVRLKDREELEEIYGVPPIKIPVFVSCLQRIDALILPLGLLLILAAAYVRSPLSFSDRDIPPVYTNGVFVIAFPLVALVHLFLSLLYSPLILPRVGVHTTAYIGLLLGLGSVFAGLGLWGALS